MVELIDDCITTPEKDASGTASFSATQVCDYRHISDNLRE